MDYLITTTWREWVTIGGLIFFFGSIFGGVAYPYLWRWLFPQMPLEVENERLGGLVHTLRLDFAESQEEVEGLHEHIHMLLTNDEYFRRNKWLDVRLAAEATSHLRFDVEA